MCPDVYSLPDQALTAVLSGPMNTAVIADFLTVQLEDAFIFKRFQRLNSFSRTVSQGAQM